MRKGSFVTLYVGFLLITACILTPVPAQTPDGSPMETPDASPEPATATPTPTLPAGFFPIIAGDPNNPNAATLLGGTESGVWIDAATAAPRLSGGETYNLYSPTGPIGTAVGTKPTRGIICPQYGLQWTPPPSGDHVIGIGGGWNALPRIPEELSTGDDAYRAAVSDWWAAQGYSGADVRLTRVLRLDLNGDGTTEELISATRLSEVTGHDVAAGDYSVVLLRKQTAPQTVQLVGEYYPAARNLAYPKTYSLSAVLDLNGDGRMEVIVDVRRWEGSGNLVYAFDGTAIFQLFDTVCTL